MPIESNDHGARELLSFGAEIEVIEPAELRAEVIRHTHQSMAVYRRAAT